jgi:DNA repair protein RadC
MTSMKDTAKEDRPREKLIARGVSVLSSEELLQVIIGSGVQGADVVKISKDLVKLLEANNGKLTLEEVSAIKGVSTATATKLLASLEVASRFTKSGTKIRDINDVAILLSDIRIKKQEHFVLLTLDGADQLIDRHIIGIGTVNASMIHPRDVFSQALVDNAASIIVAHNHPGGGSEPSLADIEVTNRLQSAGMLLGIPLQSHVIVSKNSSAVINSNEHTF